MNFDKFSRLLLTEGNQQKYYHETTYEALYAILNENKFVLRNALLKGAENRDDNTIKRPYYMSLARIPTNSYRVYPSVTLVLNGSLLNSNYTIKPIDYWSALFKKTGKNEAEERLFSSKSTIPDAKKYIDEIHVFVPKEQLSDSRSTIATTLRTLTFYNNHNEFKVYFYEDRNALFLLDKRKAISLTAEEISGGLYIHSYEKELDRIDSFLNFLNNGKANSPEDQKRFRGLLSYPRDWVHSAEADFGNFYSRSSGGYGRMINDKLIKMMREDGVKNLRQFLIVRWKKLTGKDHIDSYFPQ